MDICVRGYGIAMRSRPPEELSAEREKAAADMSSSVKQLRNCFTKLYLFEKKKFYCDIKNPAANGCGRRVLLNLLFFFTFSFFGFRYIVMYCNNTDNQCLWVCN